LTIWAVRMRMSLTRSSSVAIGRQFIDVDSWRDNSVVEVDVMSPMNHLWDVVN
jgi:hypothetical protein